MPRYRIDFEQKTSVIPGVGNPSFAIQGYYLVDADSLDAAMKSFKGYFAFHNTTNLVTRLTVADTVSINGRTMVRRPGVANRPQIVNLYDDLNSHPQNHD